MRPRSVRFVVLVMAISTSLLITACGGGSGSGGSGGSTTPTPVVTSISPASVLAGSSAFTLTVNGSGFIASSVIQVGGTAESTAYVSASQLTAAVSASQIVNGAELVILVLNGTISSSGAAVNLEVDNPVPAISSLSPASEIAGVSSPAPVVVTGTGFDASTVIDVNGTARATSFTSSTQVSVTLTAADVASAGNLSLTAVNPTPGGGTSTAAALAIAAATPNPVIASVSPTQLYVGSVGSLDVTGSNFDQASVVLWNGMPLATTFLVGTQATQSLGATVPASSLTSAGTASVTVTTPTALSPSNAVSITIALPPVPTITSISPAGVPLNTATQLTINGTGFVQSSTVQFDGNTVASNYVNGGEITVQIAGSQIPLPGNHIITVTTPGAGASNTETLTAYIAIQTNAMAQNAANGLLYVSVPGSAGPPYGDSIVSVDPATGALGTPIYVGSEPDKLAISSDGTTLWVGLDGASAVREVNLTTGNAGVQFSLADNTGVYDYPPVVHAIAVLPGSDNSIVASVTTNNGLYEDLLTIYDSGVARANTIPLSTISSLPALFVNPTKPEVYATSYESGYQVLSYDASGLTHIAGNSGTTNSSAIYGTAVQVDNGNAYLDTGVVLEAETGTLEGTFYLSGTTVATGPMVSDSTLGKNFILSANSGSGAAYTINAFNESNYDLDASDSIPVNGALPGVKYGSGSSTETELNGNNNVDTMVRWGSNGVAFRAANGVFSLRSNAVNDLSATSADLGVSISAPASASAGSNYSAIATIVNNGPSTATNAVMTAAIPAGTTVVSASSSAGSCFVAAEVSCSVGNIANAATVTVTIQLAANTAGNAPLSATVSAGEKDPVSSNNTASATTAITGTSLAPVPSITSVSPYAAQAGASDFTLTVHGGGFTQDSAIEWGTTALSTSYVSATELTADVPGSLLTSMGWAPVTVDTPSPGGGTSNALPFSIYAAVSLQANHLLYDPFTRLLYASVNSSSTQITGNSLVTIDPNTGSLGTPVSAGSQPDKMALTDDGNFLYVNLDGANAVGRFNMATQKMDFTFPVGAGSFFTPALRDIAALPGSETTIAVDLGEDEGLALYDIDPANQTATARSTSGGNFATGSYTGSSLQFLNASTLFSFDIDTTGQTFNAWAVTPTGLSGGYNSDFTLNNFSAFKIRNAVAYANLGGVANPAVTPPEQLGVFLPPAANSGSSNPFGYYSNYGEITEPDTSQGLSFFAQTNNSSSSGEGLTISVFNQQNYSQFESMSPGFTTTASSVSLIDLLRCGQEGLAILRSDGVIMLFQGGFIVPGLLTQSAPASLASSSALNHGSGNSVMTLTGSGFLPGVAVMWNGNYRTTTVVSSSQVTVDLPASDLTAAGTSTVTAVNPGATSSNSLTVTIN